MTVSTHDDPIALLTEQRLLPLITAPRSDALAGAADLLIEYGLRVVEVTLRTPTSLGVIEELVQRAPDLIVGAGSVLTPDQVTAAADAGARFIVSPGYSDTVVEATRRAGLAPLPGVATPSELQRAREQDVRTVKLFPAEQLGGVQFVDAVGAPIPDMRFVPSGGITRDLLHAYLQRPSVLAVGCSWMLPVSAFSAPGARTVFETSILEAIAVRAAVAR